jgi:tripartite ATP-independent transporter DctM subunit
MELFFLFLLILLMAFALGSGYPVAFALPGSAVLTIGLAALSGYLFTGRPDAFFAQGGPLTWLTAGVTNFRGVYWEAERDTLIAIPLFVFMGIMLQRSRIAEDLLITMAQLFGPVRGGLGMSVVFVGALLAATTGIVGATVVAMGLISLPAMLRNKYSHPLATGTIAASGTLGQIIPPSIVLIILADQLASATDQASTARKLLFKENTGDLLMPSAFDVGSTSAGEMFLGAFLPGLVLVALYIIYIGVIAFLRPRVAPTVPYEGKYDAAFAGRVVMALVPPLALIFAVLGSIIMGIATVNQAGAIGAAGALIMAGYRLKHGESRAYWPAILAAISVTVIITVTHVHPVNVKNLATAADVRMMIIASFAVAGLLFALCWSGWRALRIEETLQSVMIETAKTTSLVFIILIGAAMLTAAFRGFGGEDLVKDFLTGMPGGFWGQFVIVMAVIFILGFFLDFIEISVVVVPIVAPILLMNPGANITAVWLGVMIGLNIQTSFLTPPFGFALFYLRGVAPAIVKTISMYKGVIPFILLQLLALVIVANSPPLVNYLPQRITLSADTAPPPINPKLQVCIEDELFKFYGNHEEALRSAIASVRSVDLSALPDKLEKDLAASFDKAEQTFELIAAVKKADVAIAENEDAYRPLHVQVRNTQAEIRSLELRNKELQTSIRLARDEALKTPLEAELAANEGEIKALQATIPERWDREYKAFRKLLKADETGRNAYRRNADQAYKPVQEALAILRATKDLAALESELRALPAFVENNQPEAGLEKVQSVYNQVRSVEGARPVQSEMSEARRSLRGSSISKPDALAAINRAIQKFDEELAWRKQASITILPALERYEETIRNNIGLRQQRRLPDDLIPDIAACLSHHRDISLYF